jgi:hypothetical protein
MYKRMNGIVLMMIGSLEFHFKMWRRMHLGGMLLLLARVRGRDSMKKVKTNEKGKELQEQEKRTRWDFGRNYGSIGRGWEEEEERTRDNVLLDY